MKYGKLISILLIAGVMLLASGCYTTFGSLQKESDNGDYGSYPTADKDEYSFAYQNGSQVYVTTDDSLNYEYVYENDVEGYDVVNNFYFNQYDPWDYPFYNSHYLSYPFVGDLGFTFSFTTGVGVYPYYWNDPWYWSGYPHVSYYYSPFGYYSPIWPSYYDPYYVWWYNDYYYGTPDRDYEKRSWDKRTPVSTSTTRPPSARTTDGTYTNTAISGSGSSVSADRTSSTTRPSAVRTSRNPVSRKGEINKRTPVKKGERKLIKNNNRKKGSKKSSDTIRIKNRKRVKKVKAVRSGTKHKTAPAKKRSQNNNTSQNNYNNSSGNSKSSSSSSSSSSSNGRNPSGRRR